MREKEREKEIRVIEGGMQTSIFSQNICLLFCFCVYVCIFIYRIKGAGKSLSCPQSITLKNFCFGFCVQKTEKK